MTSTSTTSSSTTFEFDDPSFDDLDNDDHRFLSFSIYIGLSTTSLYHNCPSRDTNLTGECLDHFFIATVSSFPDRSRNTIFRTIMMLLSFLTVVVIDLCPARSYVLCCLFCSLSTTYHRRLTRHDLDWIRRRHLRLLRPIRR